MSDTRERDALAADIMADFYASTNAFRHPVTQRLDEGLSRFLWGRAERAVKEDPDCDLDFAGWAVLYLAGLEC